MISLDGFFSLGHRWLCRSKMLCHFCPALDVLDSPEWNWFLITANKKKLFYFIHGQVPSTSDFSLPSSLFTMLYYVNILDGKDKTFCLELFQSSINETTVYLFMYWFFFIHSLFNINRMSVIIFWTEIFSCDLSGLQFAFAGQYKCMGLTRIDSFFRNFPSNFSVKYDKHSLDGCENPKGGGRFQTNGNPLVRKRAQYGHVISIRLARIRRDTGAQLDKGLTKATTYTKVN